MTMADDFAYRPRYEIPNCNQVQVFKMNDDGSITYTDVEGDLSQTRYVPERTCKFIAVNEVETESDSWCEKQCSCGEWIDMTRKGRPNYCQNCGAKVVE